MKCQDCKQKEATVHFTEIMDEQVVKLHLCPGCAQARGIGSGSAISVGDLAPEASSPGEGTGNDEEPCPACGTTLKEFRKKGRLGCGRCYQAFEQALRPLLGALHR